jgi:hypothetical protein
MRVYEINMPISFRVLAKNNDNALEQFIEYLSANPLSVNPFAIKPVEDEEDILG